MNSKPDFYLTSTEHSGEWARVRSCWVQDRLHGPYHDQYARVRVEPGVPADKLRSGEEGDTLIFAPHHEGTTLFPLSGSVVPVYVYVATTANGQGGAEIQSNDVRLVAWGEVYKARGAADDVARL